MAGRVLSLRQHRALLFATLRDGEDEIQLLLEAQATDAYHRWVDVVDPGDLVVVDGEVVTTGTGALAVQVLDFTFGAVALRRPPGRRGARCTRPRHRYQLMLQDVGALKRARERSAALYALRSELHAHGFLEADTPLLHPVPSGTARPFTTHMNSWNVPLHLRVTSESYLKRLVIGGLDRVYEIGRSFRNEGTDALHFPEFSVCEAYRAHTDYNDAADLTELLVTEVYQELLGGPPPSHRFPRRDFYGLLSEVLGVPIDASSPREELVSQAQQHGIATPDGATAGRLAVLLHRKLVVTELQEATFVFDFPAEGAILARPHRSKPALVEAWSLIVGGLDVGQGCTELTDPVEQRRRFAQQAGARRRAGLNVPARDEEFLFALEHGMPPLSGLAIGVDRLFVALRGAPGRLRDHQCHPIQRPFRRDSASPDVTRQKGLQE